MKVLFATYPMAFHTPGGGEIQLLAYKKALEGKGVQVDLFNPWKPNFVEYDLVHFFSCVGGSIHFCNFIRNLGIPLVVTSSLWITEETKELYPYEEISAQLNLSDSIITNSEMESDELSKVLNIEREKFHSVYNAVDELFFNKVDGSLFRNEFDIEGKFVLNVANIEPRKNQLSLARAMQSFDDRKLVLIGHVRDHSYFDAVKAELAPEKIVHIDGIDHYSPLLRSAYDAADVFCLPSTLETPGLAALEAKALGTKGVITQEGSTKEYFGDSVVYCDPSNDYSIREAIKEATSNDDKIVSSKADNLYSWDEAIEKLIITYEETIAEKNFFSQK
ncbi:glycosyltransferase [Vibrio maerlii]|uniref:glycosyltransferase n=1 Tax=Vibrio maerlii TaxID=2231648 RepID=UPI000E3E1DE7|nr:glycosyltransferase [Vibrio maerlii]